MKVAKYIIVTTVITVLLFVSLVTPVKYKVVSRYGYLFGTTENVVYQPKNIYGMDIGEEYTIAVLTEYGKSVYNQP